MTDKRNYLLVYGGRGYKNHTKVYTILDALWERAECTHVLQGGATGADALAHNWALERGIPCDTERAQWSYYGPSAGPKRNQLMLDAYNVIEAVEFPGGNGTADMRKRLRAAGINIYDAEKHTWNT